MSGLGVDPESPVSLISGPADHDQADLINR